jgi:hypothetical protein
MLYIHPIMMCDTVEAIPITVQWMSGDITTIQHTPNKSLYHLKQTILSAIQSYDNPFHLTLYQRGDEEKGEEEWIHVTHTNYPSIFRKATHFYAVMRSAILQESLEYIYPLNGHDLWRFTCESAVDRHRIQISVVVCEKEGFCSITDYHEAKRNQRDIPWKYDVETFLRQYPVTEQALTNMIRLWSERRR